MEEAATTRSRDVTTESLGIIPSPKRVLFIR
jgi:hypothetical protein